jgi:hypothetical protein
MAKRLGKYSLLYKVIGLSHGFFSVLQSTFPKRKTIASIDLVQLKFPN